MSFTYISLPHVPKRYIQAIFILWLSVVFCWQYMTVWFFCSTPTCSTYEFLQTTQDTTQQI